MSTISVIVPAYRAEAFLDAALASVAGQTRPADEVVVVDDGSPDGTRAVAERWERLLPLVVVAKRTNEGLGAARRDGIAASSGDLVALLDADDVWLPDHLAVLEATYAEAGGVVVARSYGWHPGRRLSARAMPRRRSVPSPRRQPAQILDHNFAPCLALFSRAAYDRVGGFRPMRLDEDWDLWIRMVRGGERIALAPTVTALRRVHGASLSSAEACLDHDLALLEELRGEVAGRDLVTVDRAIRRRHARSLLFAGYAAARAGNRRQARRCWWRALWTDRSLRAPLAPGAGSVTLRAAACLLAPGRVVRLRDQRVDPSRRPHLRLAR